VRPLPALAASISIVLALQGRALGQVPSNPTDDFWRMPALGRDLATPLTLGAEPLETPTQMRSPRIMMFGMLPGFLSDPVGLNSNDDPPDVEGNYVSNDTSGGFSRMTLTFGNDNPYFDLRRPGDPGGVGYVRMHSQLQLIDSATTSVCLGLQAWTPAGLESGGVANGPTTISPGLGVFQDLGNGAGLHGYVGQNFRDGYTKQGPLRCGMAMHCPLFPWADTDDCPVFLFVQAMGRYDYAGDRQQGRAMNWELVPGVHWRFSDNFWMSIGGTRQSMLTWVWQF
jgi:hypothetical protein